MALWDDTQKTKDTRALNYEIIASDDASEEDKINAWRDLKRIAPSEAESFLRQAVQGGTYQWAHNIGITTEEGQELDYYYNPRASMAGDITGQVATSIGIGRALPVLAQGARIIRTAPTPGQRVLANVLGGAAESTATAAGQMSDDTSLLGRIGEGFMNEGFIGGSFGAGGAIAQEVAPWIMRLIRGTSAEDRGAAHVGRALREGGDTIESATRKLDEMGPGAVPADVNRQTQQTLRASMASTGEEQDKALEFLLDRERGTSPRVVGQLEGVFDPPDAAKVNPRGWSDDLAAEMKSKANPLYKELHQLPASFDDIPDRFKDNDRWLAAVKQADDWRSMAETDYGPFSMQQLDFIKRAIDDQYENAAGNEKIFLKDMTKSLIDSGNKQSTRPDGTIIYEEARNIWSGAKKHEEAFNMGRSLSLGGSDNAGQAAEDLAAKYVNMTDGEKDAVRVGLFGRARGEVRSAAPTEKRMLNWYRGSDEQKALFRTVLGDEKAELMDRIMQTQKGMRETTDMAWRGSPTARIDAQRKELEQDAMMMERLAELTASARGIGKIGLDMFGRWHSDIMQRQQNAYTTRLLMQVDEIRPALEKAFMADKKLRDMGKTTGRILSGTARGTGGALAGENTREREERRDKAALSGE